jgi:uroporphyrinogen-III synthase
MRVLVTRPLDDAEETAAKLIARGHAPVIAPLLEIRFRDGAEIALDNIQAVLVTSANGIRALAARTRGGDVRVLAVGAQSADAARDAGFANVEHAGGDVAALADLTIARLKPEGGVLFHAAGADTRGQLAERLAASGFTVRSEVLYDAIASTALPPLALSALTKRELDAVLFFSPRTAKTFAGLVEKVSLRSACQTLLAICISQAAVDALGSLDFRGIRVAARPDQDALLALLD